MLRPCVSCGVHFENDGASYRTYCSVCFKNQKAKELQDLKDQVISLKQQNQFLLQENQQLRMNKVSNVTPQLFTVPKLEKDITLIFSQSDFRKLRSLLHPDKYQYNRGSVDNLKKSASELLVVINKQC